MARETASRQTFNLVIVAQRGRLAFEALLFAASLRHAAPGFTGRLFLAEPQPGPLWPEDPRIQDADLRAALEELGGEFLPFASRHFGRTYPYGNKIELLSALPEGEPFVFFDSDTLVLDDLSQIPFDFDRPSASLRREGTWPIPQPYGPSYAGLWKSLYDRFGLDFETSLDRSEPEDHWRRFLYFNAGFFYYRCPRAFGQRFLDYALTIRDDPPVELCAQSFDPWLDQIALPLVIHALGGGRATLPPGLLDGSHTCHYRLLPLLYARESDRAVEVLETVTAPNRLKKLLKRSDAFKRMVYQGRGAKVRALFDRAHLPRREQMIRNRIKQAGYWVR